MAFSILWGIMVGRGTCVYVGQRFVAKARGPYGSPSNVERYLTRSQLCTILGPIIIDFIIRFVHIFTSQIFKWKRPN